MRPALTPCSSAFPWKGSISPSTCRGRCRLYRSKPNAAYHRLRQRRRTGAGIRVAGLRLRQARRRAPGHQHLGKLGERAPRPQGRAGAGPDHPGPHRSGRRREHELCDVTIRAPKDDTLEVQECHLLIYHALCEMLETAFFSN